MALRRFWLLAAAAVSVASAQVHSAECTYRRAIPPFLNANFSPLVADTQKEIHPQLETNATLFRRNRGGTIAPELAKSYDIDEQARTLTISLDTSCAWSDGTPITAEDYVTGLKLLFTPEAKSTYIPGRELFKNATAILAGDKPLSSLGVRADGPAKVVFDLIAPPDMLMTISTYVSMTPAPTHLMKDDPSVWPTESLVRVSSGPFTAVENQNNKITLVRNPHYCQGYKSPIDRIELIGEFNSRVTLRLFDENKLDVVEGLSKRQLDSLLAARDDTWLDPSSEQMLQYLFIANRFEQQPSIRQALFQVVDKQRMLDKVLQQDSYVQHHSHLNFSYPGYKAPAFNARFTRPYAARVAEAKQVMQKHGYGPQQRLKLSLAHMDHEIPKALALSLQSMLHQIYIDARPVVVSRYEQLFSYDLVLAGWSADFDDPFNTLSAFAQMIADKEPDLIEAIEQTNHELNHDQRFTKLSALEQRLIDYHYHLPLSLFSIPIALSDQIELGQELQPLGRSIYKHNCP